MEGDKADIKKVHNYLFNSVDGVYVLEYIILNYWSKLNIMTYDDATI